MISEEGENTMAKTKVICFTNNKGGSGKTTTCSNVGFGLRELGKKVLMIDGDMQLNLSLSLFDEDTKYEGLDLIPSSTLMSSIEYELFTKWQREYILKKGLKKIRESEVYDYILIDAPPTLGGWVMNILCASDYVILPVEASPWGLFGLGNMFEFLDSVEEIAPDLKLGGIVITKVDTRKNYFKQTLETLQELDDVKVFDTYIRVDSGIEWSQDNNAPVIAYKKSSRSAKEYMELTREIAATLKG